MIRMIYGFLYLGIAVILNASDSEKYEIGVATCLIIANVWLAKGGE